MHGKPKEEKRMKRIWTLTPPLGAQGSTCEMSTKEIKTTCEWQKRKKQYSPLPFNVALGSALPKVLKIMSFFPSENQISTKAIKQTKQNQWTKQANKTSLSSAFGYCFSVKATKQNPATDWPYIDRTVVFTQHWSTYYWEGCYRGQGIIVKTAGG